MMKRAGWVHGLRTLGLAISDRPAHLGADRGLRHISSFGLVESLSTASTEDVPRLCDNLATTAAGPILGSNSARRIGADSRRKLHASLALLPVDASQVDYLFNRLIKTTYQANFQYYVMP